MTIRIQLVDDHAITRIGVKAVLRNEEKMRVVAEVDSGHAAVAEALRIAPQGTQSCSSHSLGSSAFQSLK